jgi:hypothetical protein
VRRSVTRAIPRNPVRPLAAALAGCDWVKRPCIRPLKSTQGVSRSGRAQLARSPGPGSGCTLTASSTDRSELRERVSEERQLWAGNRLLDSVALHHAPSRTPAIFRSRSQPAGFSHPSQPGNARKGSSRTLSPDERTIAPPPFLFLRATHTKQRIRRRRTRPRRSSFFVRRHKNQETREDERLDRLDVENKKERCPNIPPLVDSSPALHNFRIPASNPLLTDSSS